MLKRGSGILLHISSLPSEYGVGDFGPQAMQFADSLSRAGQRYWQILPLTPTDAIYGNSPYSSESAFALNKIFVSPQRLVEAGWLSSADLKPPVGAGSSTVDYAAIGRYKTGLLDLAFSAFKKQTAPPDYDEFCGQNEGWLEDYALFVVLKEYYANECWARWPMALRKRTARALTEARKEFAERIAKVKFVQYVLHQQWMTVKAHCQRKGVAVIGDIPIYVNYDSVDVWANPEFFRLNDDLSPEFVAGVPPDYFSQTGQRWGNPVYNWDRLRETRYGWWLARIRHNLELFDIVRIDHFRGLINYWQIPSSEPTAVNGQWVDGPKEALLSAIMSEFPSLPIIAEDLGIITEEVTAAMQHFGCPGMKVLLFAFSGDQQTHPYLPHNYVENCIAYTGTHDNNTIIGWWQNDARDEERQNLERFIGHPPKPGQLHWDLMGLLMKSSASTVIFPLQDVLGLDGSARMNVPGTTHGNWAWRLPDGALPAAIVQKLRKLTETVGRI